MMSEIARGYVRLSQRSKRSIQKQKTDIREYCESHGNLELERTYNEGELASGWDDSREQYQQMLTDAAAGEFDALVVATGSRLGRDKLERLDVFTDLSNKHSVGFHTTRRGYVDPSAPEDILMEVLMEVFSSMSDDEGKGAEVDRLIEAVEAKIEEGAYHGRPKFGTEYSADKRSLVASGKFDIAVTVLNLHSQGGSYRDIRDKTGLDLATISRVLKNEEVYQTIRSEGEWRPELVD
jgi:DNA invertase Pin-like site-specific DNA recombinase